MRVAQFLVFTGILLVAFPALGKIVGECSDCHTMHNSQNGSNMATIGGDISMGGRSTRLIPCLIALKAVVKTAEGQTMLVEEYIESEQKNLQQPKQHTQHEYGHRPVVFIQTAKKLDELVPTLSHHCANQLPGIAVPARCFLRFS